MSRVFDGFIYKLSKESGYDYDFLVDIYNDMVDSGEDDMEQFIGVTMEHDW